METTLMFEQVCDALRHVRKRPRGRILERYAALMRREGAARAKTPSRELHVVARRLHAVASLQCRIFAHVAALEAWVEALPATRVGREVLLAVIRAEDVEVWTGREATRADEDALASGGEARTCALTGRACPTRESWCVLDTRTRRFRVERGPSVECLLRIYAYRHFLRRMATTVDVETNAESARAQARRLLAEFLDHEAVVDAR